MGPHGTSWAALLERISLAMANRGGEVAGAFGEFDCNLGFRPPDASTNGNPQPVSYYSESRMRDIFVCFLKEKFSRTPEYSKDLELVLDPSGVGSFEWEVSITPEKSQ